MATMSEVDLLAQSRVIDTLADLAVQAREIAQAELDEKGDDCAHGDLDSLCDRGWLKACAEIATQVYPQDRVRSALLADILYGHGEAWRGLRPRV